MDGFIGIQPIDLHKTLLIFEKLNDAKGAKNLLVSKGCVVGNVVPILVQDQYIEAGKKARKT